MFYDIFEELCKKKGISKNKAALEIGLSNATPTKWKKHGLTPQGETLNKIAAYFGVSTDYLLGSDEKAPTPEGERGIEDPDIRMIARAGKKMTPEQRENLRKYAQYMYPEAFKDDDT